MPSRSSRSLRRRRGKCVNVSREAPTLELVFAVKLLSSPGWTTAYPLTLDPHRGLVEDFFVDCTIRMASTVSLLASRAAIPRAQRRAPSQTPARASSSSSTSDDELATRRDVSARASGPRGGAPVSARSSNPDAADAHAEPYSFFNLATAEFPSDWTSPTARVSYRDSPLDLALMAWFMRKIAMAIDTPMPSNISYDEFIALCFLQMQGRDPNGQRDITLGIMRSLMPPGGDKIFRKLFPTNKFSLELNATICKIVFAWMVGPMEVESTTENDLGEMIASKVHIKKCRWLQESGCTGMCVNMCKTATQDFFCNDFGLQLTIKPNFEDKSCDFYFGLTPPPIEMDEALTFGCNSTCGTAVVSHSSLFILFVFLSPKLF